MFSQLSLTVEEQLALSTVTTRVISPALATIKEQTNTPKQLVIVQWIKVPCWDLCGGRREVTPKSSPLTSICILWHLSTTCHLTKTKECHFFFKERDSVSCILHVVEEDIELSGFYLLNAGTAVV